jgi:ABC-type multidrug transport system permease subunit
MSQQRSLAQPRNPVFAKICTYLVKGFCKGLFGLTILLIMLSVFGFSAQAQMVWDGFFPWIVRAAITICCILTVNSVSESL